VIAGDPNGGSLRAGHHMGAEPEALNSGANLSDVLLGGLRAHDDQQALLLTPPVYRDALAGLELVIP
jgi:hypothetical protein